jgi:hypothetical protein
VTRDDWRQLLRDAPVAALVVVGLYAFCLLIFAVLGTPA